MTNAGMTHSAEENERRFAGEIMTWLQKNAHQHKIDHLVILAPPRMLGVLRVVPPGPLKGVVEELKGDLMRLTAGQLAEHPMIRVLGHAGSALEAALTGPKLVMRNEKQQSSDKKESRVQQFGLKTG